MGNAPRVFPNPRAFDPDVGKADWPRAYTDFAHFPFGRVPRGCIGESLATLQRLDRFAGDRSPSIRAAR
jgi:cytochrome P450